MMDARALAKHRTASRDHNLEVLGVQLGSWGGMRFGQRASARWLKLLMAAVLFVVSAVMFTRGIR